MAVEIMKDCEVTISMKAAGGSSMQEAEDSLMALSWSLSKPVFGHYGKLKDGSYGFQTRVTCTAYCYGKEKRGRCALDLLKERYPNVSFPYSGKCLHNKPTKE